jgi:hypothetical protein
LCGAALPAGAAEWQAPKLLLVGGTALVGDSALFQVTLDNSYAGCEELLINSGFEGLPREQPVMVLQFEVSDDAGVVVPPGPEVGLIDYAKWRPANLILLHVGARYGYYIPLRGDWHRALRAGRYRVRATLESRIGSYFLSRPRELQRLVSGLGLSVGEAKDVLRDFTVQSEQVLLEVKPK